MGGQHYIPLLTADCQRSHMILGDIAAIGFHMSQLGRNVDTLSEPELNSGLQKKKDQFVCGCRCLIA